MTTDAAAQPENVGVSLGTFEVERYRSDGHFTTPKLMQLCGALGLTGIVLGAIAAFISQYFWLIVLFPLGMGVAVGFVGVLMLTKLHIRNPAACALAGLCAGVFAMIAMHFTSYRLFESEMVNKIPPGVLLVARNLEQVKANMNEIPEEERADIQQLVQQLEAEPTVLEAFQVQSFPQYMEYQAHQGVEIKGKGGGNGANLGYTGTWLYWGFETLLVAGMALGMMKGSAEDPYCTDENSWKGHVKFGPFQHSPEVLDDLKRGEVRVLPFPVEEDKSALLITLYPSPEFPNERPVDVFLEKLVIDKQGNAKTTNLAKLTYPEKSYVPLLLACGTKLEDESTTQVSEDEDSPSTSDDSIPAQSVSSNCVK